MTPRFAFEDKPAAEGHAAMSNPPPPSAPQDVTPEEREERLKQLDMIQATIARMAQNSFTLKGWAVTLCSALLAYNGKDADTSSALLILFPAALFWCLDGFYLSLERRYRNKYRAAADVIGSHMHLDLAGGPTDARWFMATLSRTVWPIYVSIMALAVIIAKPAWLRALF